MDEMTERMQKISNRVTGGPGFTNAWRMFLHRNDMPTYWQDFTDEQLDLCEQWLDFHDLFAEALGLNDA